MPLSSQLIAPTSSQVRSASFSDHPDNENAAWDELKHTKAMVKDLIGHSMSNVYNKWCNGTRKPSATNIPISDYASTLLDLGT